MLNRNTFRFLAKSSRLQEKARTIPLAEFHGYIVQGYLDISAFGV